MYIVMANNFNNPEDIHITVSPYLKKYFMAIIFLSLSVNCYGAVRGFTSYPDPTSVKAKTSLLSINTQTTRKPPVNVSELANRILKSRTKGEAKSLYLNAPQDSEIRHAYAVWLARNGFRKESLRILKRLVQKFPLNSRIKSDYVVVLVWDGRYAKAVRVYRSIGRDFKKPAYLYRNIGKAYYELGDFENALISYKKALIKDKSDTESWKGLILSLASLGKVKKAMREIVNLRKLGCSPSEAMLLKAFVYEKNNKYLKAYEIYSNLYENYPCIRETIKKRKIRLLSSLGPKQITTLLDHLKVVIDSASGCVSRYCQDYIVGLSMARQYEKAIRFWERGKLSETQLDAIDLSWLGWSYFKTGNLNEALALYRKALRKNPHALMPRIGIAYCFANQGKIKKARKLINRVLKKSPNSSEALFAKAYLYEKENDYWRAIRVYDRILILNPQNRTALALKIRALSSLGFTFIAMQIANKRGFKNTPLFRDIEGDLAARFIHWKGDVNRALVILDKHLKAEPGNLRATFDRILAFHKKLEMLKVIEEYKKLQVRKIKIPYWVLRVVAGAYLYEQKPFTAIRIYREALKQNPEDIESRLGLFYALQETRNWEEAERVLNELDKDLAWMVTKDGIERENWDKYRVMLARGWLYLYQDRLEDGDSYFSRWISKAPADTGIRTGLGFTHLWRGWHRKALEDFRITLNLTPEKDPDAKRGLAMALDYLVQKDRARELAHSLLEKNPKDKNNQELARYFQVEDMRKLFGEVNTTVEDTGADDIWITLGAEQPLDLHTRLYLEGVWNRSTFDENKGYYRRFGVGLRHIINATWSFNQEFSFDVSNKSDFGSLTALTCTPNDYWILEASFNSFSLAIPLRARVHGTEGKQYKVAATYRTSERSQYSFTADYLKYTDGNDSIGTSVHAEHQLITKPDFQTRIYADAFTTHNTKTSMPYFSPSGDFTLSITHMCQWVRYKLYQRSLVDRLFFTIGGYKQAGFSWDAVGSVKYEQDIDFSDTASLMWGTEINRKVYDGEPVYAWSFNLLFNYKF